MMFASKQVKLEKKIKDLNALMAEYRNEVSEAEHRFKKREMTQEELEHKKAHSHEKIEEIKEKIQLARKELDSLKE